MTNVFPLIIQTEVKKSSLVFTTPPYRSPCHPPLDRSFFQSHRRKMSVILCLRRTSSRTMISLGANVNPKLDLSVSLYSPSQTSSLSFGSVDGPEQHLNARTGERCQRRQYITIGYSCWSEPVLNYSFVLSRYSISYAITRPPTCPNCRWHPSVEGLNICCNLLQNISSLVLCDIMLITWTCRLLIYWIVSHSTIVRLFSHYTERNVSQCI